MPAYSYVACVRFTNAPTNSSSSWETPREGGLWHEATFPGLCRWRARWDQLREGGPSREEARAQGGQPSRCHLPTRCPMRSPRAAGRVSAAPKPQDYSCRIFRSFHKLLLKPQLI